MILIQTKNNPVFLQFLGEVSDSDGSEYDSSDLSQEEFNDGYDDQMMGDEEDQKRLAQMTEKEREQEIFKRVEAREIMKTRYNLDLIIYSHNTLTRGKGGFTADTITTTTITYTVCY